MQYATSYHPGSVAPPTADGASLAHQWKKSCGSKLCLARFFLAKDFNVSKGDLSTEKFKYVGSQICLTFLDHISIITHPSMFTFTPNDEMNPGWNQWKFFEKKKKGHRHIHLNLQFHEKKRN